MSTTPCPNAVSFSDSALSYVWVVITTLLYIPCDALGALVHLICALVHYVKDGRATVLWHRTLRRTQGA